MASKQEIRQEVRIRRRALAPSEIEIRSERVLTRLCELSCWRQAKTILLYHSLPAEVSTLPLFEERDNGKKLLLPVVRGEELELRIFENEATLQSGSFGVLEPQGKTFADFDAIDLAIIPGVAFDRNGHRLGYGKGYYDRLLPRLQACRIGLCFDFQLYDEIPHDPHDVRMDCIVNEKGTILF